MNDAGELVFVPAPEVTGEKNPDQPAVIMVKQPDGTEVAMVQQADGTMVPAEPQATQSAGESTVPTAPPPGQTSDILNFDEQEEDDPLADLADIGDILSSAFDDESAIDPEREALSRGLDEIDMKALLKDARNVLATFKQ
jgi:hypothetical protein